MRPYFIAASLFYLLAMLLLFTLDIAMPLRDFSLAAWTHAYMIGFVMLSFVAALAQLSPVVVEANHRYEGFFHIIWIFLVVGVCMLLAGFYAVPALLRFGGVTILVAMTFFAVTLFITLGSARRKTAVTASMRASTLFLLVGVLSGLATAFGYSGADIGIDAFYGAHTAALLGGFVMLITMGITTVLVPMFATAKRVGDNDYYRSYKSMLYGVSLAIAAALTQAAWLALFAKIFILFGVGEYIFRFYTMLTNRARVEHDIWAKHIYIAFLSLATAYLFFILSLFGIETLFRASLWLFLVGFVGFLIIGNYYKIIPFLLWFEFYAPYVGERDVPMLHEMVDARLARLQFAFSAVGLLFSSVALLIGNESLFRVGASGLSMGAILLFIAILKIFKA